MASQPQLHSRKILLLLWLAVLVWSAELFFTSRAMIDNLTGLCWIENRTAEILLYGAFVCSFLGWLSFLWLQRTAGRKTALISAACFLLLYTGLCVPYSASGKQSLLSSLHLLLCIGSVGLWIWISLRVLTSVQTLPADKKTAGQILFCLAASTVLFAWSGSVSLTCELFFVLSVLLVLIPAQR